MPGRKGPHRASDSAYYRTTWDELPDKVYHAAPRSARESILEHGLSAEGRSWNFAPAPARTDWSWKKDRYPIAASVARAEVSPPQAELPVQ